MKTNNSPMKQVLKKRLQWVRLQYLVYNDVRRFFRNASLSALDPDHEKVVARIMYNVHALEKGLARNREVRLGFGKKALANLNDSLVVFRNAGYSTSDFAYEEGVSVLHRYRELHDKAGFELDFLDNIVDGRFLNEEEDSGLAGSIMLRKSDKALNRSRSFPELAKGRRSVREFSGRPIDTSKVMDALRYAEKTPSVCNRQGWKVYWVEDDYLAERTLRHQRGFGYSVMPEVLLCVTVTTSAFVSPVERNEAFIDGGLFCMSVLYGLECEGLAAVPLNACMYHKDQIAVRELLAIDDSDVIIMFIAVGDFMDESLVPVSDRKPASDFVKRRRGPSRTVGRG